MEAKRRSETKKRVKNKIIKKNKNKQNYNEHFYEGITSFRTVRSIRGNAINCVTMSMLPFSAARWRAVHPS